MKKLLEKFKNGLPKWSSKHLKKGSYSIGVTLVVIGILLVVNLIVGKLPSAYTKLDLSSNQLYTIGDTTKEAMAALEEDVTIYQIAQSDEVDSTLSEVLSRYEGLSSHIKTEVKDPVLYPNFVSQYTDEDVSTNSLIVVSDKRSKIIDYNDIYETSIDYSTYSQSVTGFDGEGQITSAISYVTSDTLPVMYVLEGHQEDTLSDSMKSAVEKENIEMKELNLLTEEQVPEDADSLFILSPKKDISEEEAEKIIAYLEGGGKAFIATDYSETEMPNLASVLSDYGVKTKEGVVMEGDAKHYASGNPSLMVPNIGTAEAAGDMASENTYVLLPVAQAVEKLDSYRDTVQIESLLTTSDSAYNKKDAQNLTTLSKEDGDEEGPFDLGVAISETNGDAETKLVYVTCGAMFNDSIDAVVAGGNTELLVNCLSWMTGQEESISIPSKSLQQAYLTITSSDAAFWSSFTTAFLPVAFLIVGGVIWFKRRKA